MLPLTQSMFFYFVLAAVFGFTARDALLFFFMLFGIPLINIGLYFLVLRALIVFTGNREAFSKKKTILVAGVMTVLIGSYTFFAAPFMSYSLNNSQPPLLVAFKLYPYFYNTIVGTIVPMVISLLILSLLLRGFRLQKWFVISLIATILNTSWIGLYLGVLDTKSALVNNARGEQKQIIERISTAIIQKTTHRLVSEELVNDVHSNNRYKSLRFKLLITTPEAGTYGIGFELRDLKGRDMTIQAYINGQNAINSPINIALVKGENQVVFDFPYVFLNKYNGGETINLPYDEVPNGSYGPFKLKFWIFPLQTETYNYTLEERQKSSAAVSSYDAKIITTKVYNYLDFYAR